MLTANLSAQQFEFIRGLIYEHTRISIEPSKEDVVHSRLGKRLRALVLNDYDQYCELLQSPDGDAELQKLVDAISTNHTFFFREEQHFEFLKDRALKEIELDARDSSGRTFRVWSAACSSGEEPCSIAILLNEHPFMVDGLLSRLTATDISRDILKRAATGVYDLKRIRNMPDAWFRKYFLLGRNSTSGKCRVRPELQKGIDFRNLNLFQEDYGLRRNYHVIFCRNVMIYFDNESCEKLVNRLFDHLVPGGYLMVGHSESLMSVRHGFDMVQAAIYRKPG